MSGVLLDTHVLIWAVEGDDRLGKRARGLINAAQQQGQLFVSAISFWEIGMLLKKNRMKLSRPLDFWRADIISHEVNELAITGDIAIWSTELEWNHPDPADRLVVATAIASNLNLITADKVILQWKNSLKRSHAKK